MNEIGKEKHGKNKGRFHYAVISTRVKAISVRLTVLQQ